MNRINSPSAISLFAIALAAPSLQAADAPQVRQAGNVSYVSGGVSDEGRDSLQALGAGFNLKLILATRSGAYLSDVDLVINDAGGRHVLDARSDGPWFYAKLPKGTYQIAASANGKTLRKLVTIETQGQNKVDLRWDD